MQNAKNAKGQTLNPFELLRLRGSESLVFKGYGERKDLDLKFMEVRSMTNISKTRGFLYWLAKILGDINAVQKGKVGKRIIRRGAGKVTVRRHL